MEDMQIHTVCSGDVSVWVEPSGGIHLKLNNVFKDPVELSEEEAIELANLLLQLAAQERQ